MPRAYTQSCWDHNTLATMASFSMMFRNVRDFSISPPLCWHLTNSYVASLPCSDASQERRHFQACFQLHLMSFPSLIRIAHLAAACLRRAMEICDFRDHMTGRLSWGGPLLAPCLSIGRAACVRTIDYSSSDVRDLLTMYSVSEQNGCIRDISSYGACTSHAPPEPYDICCRSNALNPLRSSHHRTAHSD